MDNLSHALVSLAAGELIHRCLKPEGTSVEQSRRRRLLLVAALVSGNFPDLDLVLTPLLPEPLGYLLHHRGHTHTFLYALPQAFLVGALLFLLWPSARRLLARSVTARAGFVSSIAVGLLSHIGMDYLNSYGIHPFHPFDSRWFYGDMVFIIEPFFWVVFGVPLMMMVPLRWLRTLLLMTLAGVIFYFTWEDYLAWLSFAVLLTLAVLLALAQRRAEAHGKAALACAIAVSGVFVGAQATASAEGGRIVSVALQSEQPDARILDVAMTPFPSNPACWMFASIARDGADYLARRGVISIAPSWLPVTQCPASLAGLERIDHKKSEELAYLFSHRGDLYSLRRLYEEDCFFRAWMRFARMPMHNEQRAADIRFDREADANFTAIDLQRMQGKKCPGYVPQWVEPRRDLLEP